jgi:hypothetical protein
MEGIDECGGLRTGRDRRRRLVTYEATEKQEKNELKGKKRQNRAGRRVRAPYT